MRNKNFINESERRLRSLADAFEAARLDERSPYMDADDLADLADYYNANRQKVSALEVVLYGLELHPDDDVLLVEYAYLLMDDDDMEEVEQVLKRLSFPDDPECVVVRAQYLLRNDDEEGCKQLLNTLSDEDKTDIANVINIFYMYLESDMSDEAMEWLLSIEEKEETSEVYLASLADAYAYKGEWEKLIPLCEELLDIDPYSPSYWLILGRAYFGLAEYNKTIDAVNFALISDEEYGDAYYLRGEAFYLLDNLEEAVANFKEAFRLGKVTEAFYETYAALLAMERNEWEEAGVLFGNITNDIESSPFSHGKADLVAYFALTEFMQGRKDLAYTLYKETAVDTPNTPIVHLVRGRMYAEDRLLPEAIEEWRKVIELDSSPSAWKAVGKHFLRGYAVPSDPPTTLESLHITLEDLHNERGLSLDEYLMELLHRCAHIRGRE
jgi:tetratricopeptide (TPR) repeat protein